MKTKEWVRRAGRTFLQAFIGSFSMMVVASVSGATDIDALKTALLSTAASSIAAGIAALMNLKNEESEE